MKARPDQKLAWTMLMIAACVVPASQRHEWLMEWQGELSQLLWENGMEIQVESSPTRFAFGSFLDAFWLRRESFGNGVSTASILARPARCLAVLAVFTVASVLTLLAFSDLRQQILPSSFQGPQNIQVLSRTSTLRDSDLLVSAEDYQLWSSSNNPVLDESIYYQFGSAVLQTSTESSELSIGWSENVPSLFGTESLSSAVHVAQQSNTTALVLSYALWKRQFAADFRVIGRHVWIAGRQAIIVGIAPQWATDLPGSIDAWGIVDVQKMKVLEAQRFAYGYVLRKSPPSEAKNYRQGNSLTVHDEHGSTEQVEAHSLDALAREHRKHRFQTFLSSVRIATILMPFILTIWPISFAHFRSLKSVRLRFLAFLLAKVALLIPLVYCIPVSIAVLCTGRSPDAMITVQALITDILLLLAVYWCFHDQAQRCPNCLLLLSNPAHVGEISRSFLAWSGTEFMCREGHGLLHVPDYSTSWYPEACWLTLDSSWEHLFQA